MKILLISELFFPVESGAEKVARIFGEDLVRRGHEVTVVTNRMKSRATAEVLNGIAVERILLYRRVRFVERVTIEIFRLMNVFILLRHLKKNRYDVVNVHGFNSLFLSAGIAGKLVKMPVVLVMCTSDIFDVKENEPWTFRMIKQAVRYCDCFVAKGMSPTPMMQMLDIPEYKFRHIVNPALTMTESTMDAKPETSSIREKYHLGKKFVIGLVGKLEYTKNPLVLIEMMKLLNDSTCALMFVGSGSMVNECRMMTKRYGLEKQVLFVDHTTNVGDYYKIFDVYIFPTLLEPALSQAMMEAMFYAVPTIVRDSEGLRHWFRNNEDCIMVEKITSEILAEKVQYLRRNSELRRRIGETGRKTIQKNHSISEFTEQMLQVFSTMGAADNR